MIGEFEAVSQEMEELTIQEAGGKRQANNNSQQQRHDLEFGVIQWGQTTGSNNQVKQ
jgi:hypothetical protein